MRRIKKTILVVLLSIVHGSAVIFLVSWYSPLDDQQDHYQVFELLPKANAHATLDKLQHERIITVWQKQLLLIYLKVTKQSHRLQAGDYCLSTQMALRHLLAKFMQGKTLDYSLTFVEGTTFADILKLMAKHPRIKHTLIIPSELPFLSAVEKNYLSPEGLFFPETYTFKAHTSDKKLLETAYRLMQLKLARAWENRSESLLKTPYEALILASIIEKETAKPQEYFLISGVFHRRLALHMRLQTDVAVIYGLGPDLQGRLKYSHLKFDTPFNTYLHAGLPPTPIACPGQQAIEAAVHPDASDNLYFVSKKNGFHEFSVSLAAHNAAVERYQKN